MHEAEKPDPIEEYICMQDASIRPILRLVRQTISEAIPDAEAKISWKMPTWRRRINLIHFAAQKQHLGVYPGPEAVAHFAPILDEQGWDYSKGTIRFPYDSIPLDLIRQIAEYCGKAV